MHAACPTLSLSFPCLIHHACHQRPAAAAGHTQPQSARTRPGSAARLRALVLNPSALPDVSCLDKHSVTEQGEGAQGGTGRSICSKDGAARSSSSSSSSNRGQDIAEQQRAVERGAGSDIAEPTALTAACLDSQVDTLKGGVAAILSKHGLKAGSLKGLDQTSLPNK